MTARTRSALEVIGSALGLVLLVLVLVLISGHNNGPVDYRPRPVPLHGCWQQYSEYGGAPSLHPCPPEVP